MIKLVVGRIQRHWFSGTRTGLERLQYEVSRNTRDLVFRIGGEHFAVSTHR